MKIGNGEGERRKSVPRERFARAIKQDRLANRDENPAAIFFLSPWGKRRGKRRRRMARLDSVRASTDKRQTPSPPSSFVCFKRHLFGGGGGGSSAVPPRTVSRREGASEGPSRWKGCGRYGVAWLERPHLNATGKGPSALSSLRLCRATYATRPHTSRP